MGKWFLLAVLLVGCSSGNLEDVKRHAPDVWKQAGYRVVGYAGYQWGFWGFTSYGGAEVWHTLVRPENPHVIYSGFIQRWGSEYHIYGPGAVDAISPTGK